MDNINKDDAAKIRELLNKKYDSEGAESMSEKELLTLIISIAEPDNAVSAAEKLLSAFGTLDNILFTSPEKLEQASGSSLSTITLIKLIPTLAYKRNFGSNAPFRINTPYLAKLFFEKLLFDPTSEKFAAAAVDHSFRKAAELYILNGSSSRDIAFSSADIASYALGSGAKYVFIAHSHPEGTSEPSNADVASTAELVQALYKLGISVVDHIITGRDSAFSMRTQGFSGMFPPVSGYSD